MKNLEQKQRGMTGLGWLTILFLIGFFALLTFKIAPIYLENYSVKSTLKSFEEEPLITKRTKADIQRMIMARLNTNGVRDIKRNHVKIKKKPGLLRIAIDYSVQKNMVGNLDILVTFHDKIELVSN